MLESVKKAREFSVLKHGKQKYGEHPYVYHLDKVYEVIIDAGLSVDYQIAAYLHDCIEDTDTNKEEISKIFNENVANLVFSVTGVGENRKERKISTIDKLNEFNEGISLKMADRLVNIRESKNNNIKLFKMYKKEHVDYTDLFNKGSFFIKNELDKILGISMKLKLK